MYKLQVTADKLNIRNSPSADPTYANWVGNMNNGEIFTAVGTVKGDAIDGNDDWYVDNLNRYTAAAYTTDVSNFQDWMIDLKLPEIWKIATGKGVGIAVIDTGVQNNIDQLPYNNDYYMFDNTENIEDTDGHGTYCAALIGLKSLKGNLIGVAYDSELFVGKIADSGSFDNNEIDSTRYADAIEWCANKKEINIISISWGNPLNNGQIKNGIQNAITKAINNNKIVICAIGDATSFGDNSQYFPACLNNTICVGSIPVEDKVYPFVNQFLSIAMNGCGIESFKIDNFKYSDCGTSWSNAIMAGILALIIQKLNYNYTSSKIMNILKEVIDIIPYSIDGITCNIPTLNSNKLFDFFKN
jgi:subtilisin family serine protease